MFMRVGLTSCILALVGFTVAAQAADLDNIIYAKDLPMTQPVEVGNGWYLRGDMGYSLKTKGSASNYTVFTAGPPSSYSQKDFDSHKLAKNYSASAGVGYQFTDYLRADVTFDFTKGKFNGTTSSNQPCTGSGIPAGTTCVSSDRQDFKQYGVMANAYLDLGTYAGFTPYVGAGAGLTHVDWKDLYSDTRCVNGTATCAGTVANVAHPGFNSWRFAYAFMAGVSYDITRNLKLDLGYKYSKIASGKQFGFDAGSVTSGAQGTQASDHGFEKHEVRAGLRYSLF